MAIPTPKKKGRMIDATSSIRGSKLTNGGVAQSHLLLAPLVPDGRINAVADAKRQVFLR
jgi:hypothetical protein